MEKTQEKGNAVIEILIGVFKVVGMTIYYTFKAIGVIASALASTLDLINENKNQ